MKQPKVVLLVFVSGKIVLTGAKSREDIYQAFENIYPVLQEFRKSEILTPIPLEAQVGNQQQEVEPAPQLPAPSSQS